jgi:HSP20 family protein
MMATNISKKSASTPSLAISRDPFSAMREEMNDLISRIWYGQDGSSVLALTPAVDVSEDDNAYEIRVDAPGVSAENFDIQVQGNTISISGKREEEKEEKDKTFHRIERRSGSFSRAITLPSDINEDEVAAQYDNGVLTLTLPKSEKSKSRKISVKK